MVRNPAEVQSDAPALVQTAILVGPIHSSCHCMLLRHLRKACILNEYPKRNLSVKHGSVTQLLQRPRISTEKGLSPLFARRREEQEKSLPIFSEL